MQAQNKGEQRERDDMTFLYTVKQVTEATEEVGTLRELEPYTMAMTSFALGTSYPWIAFSFKEVLLARRISYHITAVHRNL